MFTDSTRKRREATEDEKRVLVRYVGWGGIPQVFADPAPSEWKQEAKRLKELLTAEEYEFARASTLNAHYTSATVISAIYDAVQRLGFQYGRVLEPASASAISSDLMPAEMQCALTTYGYRDRSCERKHCAQIVSRRRHPHARLRDRRVA